MSFVRYLERGVLTVLGLGAIVLVCSSLLGLDFAISIALFVAIVTASIAVALITYSVAIILLELAAAFLDFLLSIGGNKDE